MNRVEFIQKLRQALSSDLNYSLVDENVEFYQNYIDMEIRKGRNEEEVLRELGDPRLIAKTIIETNKVPETYYQEEFVENDPEENQPKMRTFKISGWLMTIGIICIVVLMIGFFTTLLVSFLPYILLIIAISFLVKTFRRR